MEFYKYPLFNMSLIYGFLFNIIHIFHSISIFLVGILILLLTCGEAANASYEHLIL